MSLIRACSCSPTIFLREKRLDFAEVVVQVRSQQFKIEPLQNDGFPKRISSSRGSSLGLMFKFQEGHFWRQKKESWAFHPLGHGLTISI